MHTHILMHISMLTHMNAEDARMKEAIYMSVCTYILVHTSIGWKKEPSYTHKKNTRIYNRKIQQIRTLKTSVSSESSDVRYLRATAIYPGFAHTGFPASFKSIRPVNTPKF
jgi:hypothetical protein